MPMYGDGDRNDRGAEITLLFEDTVLEVRCLRGPRAFSIGDGASADLQVADAGPTIDRVRVTRTGMVEVLVDDEVRVLADGDEVRLPFGAVTVLVRPTALPRALRLGAPVDLRAHATTALVGVFIAVGLAGLSAIPTRGHSLALDAPQPDERSASISMAQRSAHRDRSEEDAFIRSLWRARIAPLAHRRGSSPSAQPIDPSSIEIDPRAIAEVAANEAGVLGVLRDRAGSHVGASIFGRGSAFGDGNPERLADFLGGITCGCGPGEPTFDPGRLPGTETSIAIDGPLGVDDDQALRGVGGPVAARALPSREASAPADVRANLLSSSPLDHEFMRRVVRRHLPELRFCYEHQLGKDERLSGRVVTRVTISGEGSVVAAATESSTLGRPEVAECVASAFRRFEFPKLVERGSVATVRYPLTFTTREN